MFVYKASFTYMKPERMSIVCLYIYIRERQTDEVDFSKSLSPLRNAGRLFQSAVEKQESVPKRPPKGTLRMQKISLSLISQSEPLFIVKEQG